MNRDGYVYLLCDGEKFKIGMTRQSKIEKRILELQTGNPNEIWLHSYYKTKYPNKIEKMMHSRHASSNVKNEWFDMTVTEVLNFKNECAKCEKILDSIQENPFM